MHSSQRSEYSAFLSLHAQLREHGGHDAEERDEQSQSSEVSDQSVAGTDGALRVSIGERFSNLRQLFG